MFCISTDAVCLVCTEYGVAELTRFHSIFPHCGTVTAIELTRQPGTRETM